MGRIYLRDELFEDPRVYTLSRVLNENRSHVVGYLARLWTYADLHSRDGLLPLLTGDDVDRLVEHDGFAAALVGIGWLEIGDGYVSIPRYHEHCGDSAKKRRQDRDRQKRHRAKKSHGPVTRDKSVSHGKVFPSSASASASASTRSLFVTEGGRRAHVNDRTDNDLKKKRPEKKVAVISDHAVRTRFGLTADQVPSVHDLVDLQVELLGAGDRNHAAYVKRAAEAVRDGLGERLRIALSDFKQAASTLTVHSRPAYFHTVWHEAQSGRRRAK